jgi:hypothetical protein
MKVLTEKDRRALRLGLGIVVPALMLKLVGLPFIADWKANQQQIDSQRDLYRREIELIAQMDANNKVRAATAGQVAVGYRRVLTSDQPNLAAAGALAYVDSIAATHRVTITENAARGVKPSEANLQMLTTDLTATSDLQGILMFMRGLESGPLLVRIPNIELSAQSASPTQQTVQLKASIELFFAPEAAKQKRAAL